MTVIALLINNAMTGRVSFGQGASSTGTLAFMFGAAICGIVARSVFYLQPGQFSWLDFFKPIAISPIVLLPLIGSVETASELNKIQVVAFSILAFQNGFFWQAVLESSRPSTHKQAVK